MSDKILQYEYQFEIETILQQFLAIVDNAIVMRYDKNHDTGERTLVNMIKPQYVFGTKARVLMQLVNKAKNYTLPLIVVSLKSIKADKERLADKLNAVTRYYDQQLEGYRRPTPITLSVTMTVIAKYMTDLYQIFGKFMAQFQPYCVYSWLVPSNDNFSKEELRNKIEWDMNLSMDVQEKRNETDEDRYTATLNFTVEGWLFSGYKSCTEGIILDIGTSVIAENDVAARTWNEDGLESAYPFAPIVDKYIETYERSYDNPREFANAHPRILFGKLLRGYGTGKYYFSLIQDRKTITLGETAQLVFNGYNLKNAKAMYTVSDKRYKNPDKLVTCDYGESELFKHDKTTEKKNHKITGFDVKVLEQTQNKLVIDLNDIEYRGEVDIIVYDNVDYSILSDVIGFKLILK